ncbi:NAD binding Rossmann fold oxidoreductase, putative [Cordyceps militaris CM01]|uniref:NAD binding Rossmann fold oxidoreductase, putative n=1 Tax=Cordyceps militaris (strain CM01) TaxID=983644 RepID=G3J8S4_CORMM|nr:NAD binding Rossmann fold oxidoreductase, putative [Cordyceps militaris CM01]EGX94009.1 NAD binding Rossmann fold oxidoreductase, putative [Cordyceps militaris CM01]
MTIKDTPAKITNIGSMKAPSSLVTPIAEANKDVSNSTNSTKGTATNGIKIRNEDEPNNSTKTESSPRFVIIGAGARGYAYATTIHKLTNGLVSAVAEPLKFSRENLGKKFIWQDKEPQKGQSFLGWREYLDYEIARRKRVAEGEDNVPPGADGAFVCVQDAMHEAVVIGLAPLNLHIMCEKPLSTTLQSCLKMYRALKPTMVTNVFSIGHVLRYTQHNMLLRKLIVEDKAIGNISSVVHTEPVGWWHFTHSFVRGNWRNEQTSGPSLLTKSCHDIDFLLWMLCSPEKAGEGESHIPSTVSSQGGLNFFKKSRKPSGAGDATNCMKCALGDSGCKYSAKNLYIGPHRYSLEGGNLSMPVNIVVHDIEDYKTMDEKKAAMTRALEADWDKATPREEVAARQWYGRCVFEADNNVNDEQFVTISFPETNRPAKQVTFHMVAQTKKICERFTHYYGDEGEIYADGYKITVENFATGEKTEHDPKYVAGGHGSGDQGLTVQFVAACDAVKNKGWAAEQAQNNYIGCTLDEALRSHAMVFAAEEARKEQKIVHWPQWWSENVGDDSQ